MAEGLKRARRAALKTQLTVNQILVLAYLKTQPEGARTVWIAEACGHFFDTPWAARIMRRLVGVGLVERMGPPGWYALTEDGENVAKTKEGERDG